MADDFAAGLEELRRRIHGGPPPAQQGKPPLASYHGSVRLLPDAALKALGEAGVNLQSPSKTDRDIINDLRKYNKLADWPWPEDEPKPGATDASPGGAPKH